MTWPTPILVEKSPRPTEESNLAQSSVPSYAIHRRCRNSLLALVVGGIGIEESAGVLHGDGVALLGLVDTIAGGNELLGDTHGSSCRSKSSDGARWSSDGG